MSTNFSRIPSASLFTASLVSALCLLSSTKAGAEPSVFKAVERTCTTINCKADTIRGRIGSTQGLSNSVPWNGQFVLGVGHCARFDVTGANADLVATLVQPNGPVYIDDDSGLGLNPLLGIASVPLSGVYTLVVNRFGGSAVDAAFVLKVAQYPLGTINCVNTIPKSGGATSKSAASQLRPSRRGGTRG